MEQKRIPVSGEFYRHFKGNLYQVIGVATHSETEEQMVVYQALYGDFGLYVRPLSEFVGKVDKAKYPDVLQEYRFEITVPGETARKAEGVESHTYNAQVKTEEHSEPMPKSDFEDDSEETIREEILRFLDAEGAADKLRVLREIKPSLDETLVTTIELSMDLLPDDKESLERRIDLIEWTLEQKIRYEGGRLR